MKKKWYQSKTIWGFGIALLAGLSQVSGFVDGTVVEVVKYVGTGLGVYGVRDALG